MALRNKTAMQFKEQLRNIDIFMIDDIQFIAGKQSTQEEFFHSFNALLDQNKMIIIAGDRPPSDLQGFDERLRSRLGWGLVTDLQPASYELRLGILKAKAAQKEITLPSDVAEFLAQKITTSIRELEARYCVSIPIRI